MLYCLRFLIVTLVSFLVVIGKSFFRRTIAVSLCAIFSFNSLTWGSLLLETRGANAALPSPNVNPEITLIRKPPSKGSHEVIEKDEKTAICLPIVGCIDTPAPDVLERPLEGAIKGEVYNALAKVLDEEAPITSSAKAIFPTVATLPGETFNADGNASKLAEKLILLPDGSTILPVGDYSIPLDVFCMKHSASSPNGHRYLLAPLQGSMSAVISALNARSVGYGVPRSQLQVLSWNIQAGMKFEDMTRENQQIIDALLPDYKEKLSVSFLEKLEATYNQFAPLVGGLPSSLDSASGRLGDIGETIRTLKGLQGTLRQYGNDYDGLSRLLVSPSSPEDGGYQKGGPANTPWSKISDRVYGRLVTEGSYSSPAELQLRVLPSSNSVKLSQGVLIAEGKSNSSKSDLVAQNPLLASSQSSLVRQNITNLVGDPQSSGIQPLSFAPLLISLLFDFSPVGTEKGFLEALLGKDLITEQELKGWQRWINLIPIISTIPKIVKAAKAAKVAEGARDIVKGFDKAVDVAKASDKAADVAKASDKAVDVAKPGDKAVDAAKASDKAVDVAKPGDKAVDAAKTGEKAGGDITKPSRALGESPRGDRTPINPRASRDTQRGLQRENESADLLAQKGYDVVQNPPTLPNGKNPDYLIEGKTFDNLAPITSNPNQIRIGISDKVSGGQADRIILNMDDSKVNLGELRNLLDRKPVSELKEIIIVRDGKVIPFFP
jgi:Contact-dependent growth inhibition CdiA C-terminal domain/Pre-toxin TG